MSTARSWPDQLFEGDAPPARAWLLSDEGWRYPLQPHRWHSFLSAADASVLERARPAVLDIGCGPGRHVAALAAEGVEVLGIDSSPAAVAGASGRGAPATCVSVFGPVPRPGTWATCLLLDGNIGIGGDPARLLARCRGLLGPGGTVLAETDAPHAAGRAGRVQVVAAGHPAGGAWFRWATVPAAGMGPLAEAAGFRVADQWCVEGRWFSELRAARPALRSLEGP